jgi:hypothetical protein
MAVEIVSAKLEALSSGGAPPSRSKIISSSHKGAIFETNMAHERD